VDPFSCGELGVATNDVPPVEMCDLALYLILRTSYLTMKQFKAHKGLEAYNQFMGEECVYTKSARKIPFSRAGMLSKIILTV